MTPDNVKGLVKEGFKVVIEKGAGLGANFPDSTYVSAGATIVNGNEAWGSDIVLKVRPPSKSSDGVYESQKMKKGARLISFVYPAQNKELVDSLAKQEVTVFAMDSVPRISRSQVFDALSSMANISGYKAVVEAANHFGRFFAGQITAAGKVPPAKVLVIGAGVAGLAAIQTAKNMGAIVRAFDTRLATKEQCQSLGAEFLEVDYKEEGEGKGGYGKEMSKEFIEAEMALFMKQAQEVDVIITTALIPGKKAPTLIKKEMVEAMKEGSVVVDLAAESGGNIETTRPGEVYVHKGVTCIGYTDLPSRLPTQSSALYSNNITKFLMSLKHKDLKSQFYVDLNDEVTRGSIVLHKGEMLWPAPPPASAAAAAPAPKPKAAVVEKPVDPYRIGLKNAIYAGVGMTALLAIGMTSPPGFMTSMSIFSLATIVGYQVVWGVTPALHSPLMSVTNAISGTVIIGGYLLMGGGLIPENAVQWLSVGSVFLASINIFGGFLVTKRMLDMFRRPTDPPDYNYLLHSQRWCHSVHFWQPIQLVILESIPQLIWHPLCVALALLVDWLTNRLLELEMFWECWESEPVWLPR
eukprot:TRINITY_DN6835_c0_g1_i2.p1 TRINITY_DN6835_c0_g1~~TRINITY_DN6835_c0_g1_i2.p1  ORF type:complete len:579 (-),score=163.51 TRINITY_DN6835_c0_g1_i2:1317-3053(-)